MIKVYLAGGFHTNWQEKVIESLKDKREISFSNPKDHGLLKSNQYYLWDTLHLEKCDIVLAYLEKTNPLALGLIFELGYARGLGKKVVLVDEKSEYDSEYAKQFKFAKESVDIILEDLEEAIKFLESFS